MIARQKDFFNNLPSDWTFDRLKDVSHINISSLSAATDPEYEFDYLEISNVNYFGIIDYGLIERLRFEDAPSRARRRVNANNTVISSVRPNLQAIAYLKSIESDLICSTGFNVVQPFENRLSPKFIYYGLLSEDGRQYLEATAKGVGYPAVDDKDFGNFPVKLPPLKEQQLIADYLDASCAAIDSAIGCKSKQIESLKELRAAWFHQIFSNKSWPQERIKDIVLKIGSGVTPDGGAANYLDHGIPLIRSQNVTFEGLKLDDVAYISEDTHKLMSNSQLKPCDVLLNITGASIGRCTYVPEEFGEANVNQHVCIIRCNHKIDYRFLAAFLQSPVGQNQVFSSFTGASRQGLSHKELGLMTIPLPEIEIQVKVVEEFDKKLLSHKQIQSCIEKQIAALLAYRRSLIHECVTGRRRVTEADVKKVREHGW